MRCWLSGVLFLWVLVAAGVANAQSGCPASVMSWVEQCRTTSRLSVEAERCSDGKVIVRLTGAADLAVEIAPTAERAFRKVGKSGLSPIAEIADWSQEPQTRRTAFDTLTRCVERGAPTFVRPRTRGPPTPWLLILGLGLLPGLALARPRSAPRVFALTFGLALGTYWVRSWLWPEAFFHQNGHGPRWVQMAVTGLAASGYGPGFAEVFTLPVRHFAPDVERGVFLVQGALAALAPGAVYITARALVAPRLIAAVLALVVLGEPILGRLAQSESYFGTLSSLTFLAVMALVVGARASSTWQRALGAVAAGALLAQAVRIHPLAWVPVGIAPLIVLVVPGALRRRGRIVWPMLGAVAAVVFVSSGPMVWDVMTGRLGQDWLPRAGFRLDTVPGLAFLGIAALAAGVLYVFRDRQAVLWSVLSIGAVVIERATDMLSAPNPAVDAAAARLYWPLGLALLAAISARAASRLARRSNSRRHGSRHAHALAAGVLAVAFSVHLASSARVALALPTDTLEAELLRQWRASLPRDAEVSYLSRANSAIVVLPLYTLPNTPQGRPLSAPDATLKRGPNQYYLRSSLCGMAGAKALCERLESQASLEQVRHAVLPARPSMRHSPYAEDAVEVVLFRVTGEQP